MITVARPSRPPGFDMTYRPTESVFGPPWVYRVPSFLYLTLALAIVAVVIIGENSPSNSWLYIYIVEKDVHRILGARTLALVMVISSLAAMLRASMRGVRIRGDGLEFRDVMAMGWPRIRRFKWAQIDRIILDQPTTIALDLWDGSRAFLPRVNDRDALSAVLEKVAAARAIPVRGGAGLDDIPDSGEFEDEEAAT
jgi:hypothetical protein